MPDYSKVSAIQLRGAVCKASILCKACMFPAFSIEDYPSFSDYEEAPNHFLRCLVRYDLELYT